MLENQHGEFCRCWVFVRITISLFLYFAAVGICVIGFAFSMSKRLEVEMLSGFGIGLLVALVGFLCLWLIAEFKCSIRWRILCALPFFVVTLLMACILSVAITQLDDQSYYSASVQTLLDETIESLESGDPTLLPRLKEFSDSQSLTYESRADLLENLRQLREDGKRERKAMPLSDPA